MNINQRNVAANGQLSSTRRRTAAEFLASSNSAAAIPANALTQMDGEDATGAERGAFELTNEFLGLMLDPFVYGRGGAGARRRAARLCARQQASFPPDVALAYAGDVQGAAEAQAFDQRWTVWGAGFGGSGTANGDPAVGSNNVTASTYGFAAGADYHVSPDTVLGFALAGSGTNWDLAQGARHRTKRCVPGRRLRHQIFRAGLYWRRVRLHQQLVHHQSRRAGRSAHSQFPGPELWRAARERLSLCGGAGDGRDALCGDPGAGFSHAKLQRNRSDRRRLWADLQRDERHRYAQRARRPLRCAHRLGRDAGAAARAACLGA